MWFGAGFISHARTASLLISLREAARKVPNFAQPIILAYGTYASAKVSCHSAGAWLYGVLRKKRNGAKALTPPKKSKSPRNIKCRRVIQHEFTLGRIARNLTVKKFPVCMR